MHVRSGAKFFSQKGGKSEEGGRDSDFVISFEGGSASGGQEAHVHDDRCDAKKEVRRKMKSFAVLAIERNLVSAGDNAASILWEGRCKQPQVKNNLRRRVICRESLQLRARKGRAPEACGKMKKKERTT